MKITFENQSYIEVSKSNIGKVYISIAAREKDGKALSIHSVELTKDQLDSLINNLK